MDLQVLTDYLCRRPRAMLLFSGGLDSTLLLAAGARALGPGLTALTLVGPHICPGETAAALRLTRRLGVRHFLRSLDTLALPEFRHNLPNRCYACKRAVIEAAWLAARRLGADTLWDGTNLDDLSDFRPGLRAARELGVTSPLKEVGWGKQEIRQASRELGLPWDKPAQSCLATRFPYHTELTAADLAKVGEAEAWLQRRGFTRVRLRVRGPAARLELREEEWGLFLQPGLRRSFLALLNRLGWREVELAGR